MLVPDSDIASRRSHRLPILPLLLVGDQSPLNEDVVQEDVHNDVVPCVDLSRNLPAATDDMLRVERNPGLAVPTSCLGLLRDNFFPLPRTEEDLLYLPFHFQSLGGAVQCTPSLLQGGHLNEPWAAITFSGNDEDFVS